MIFALLPALAFACWNFGFRALAVTGVSAAGCVFWEWLYRALRKKPASVGDLSAVVTGILLAFVCPVQIAYWQILIGDFFAIVVVKQLFGGIGKNFMNPALAARAFLLISWAGAMKILIGPENVSDALRDTSVVVASYDIGDDMRGLIGVVGPTRMDYATVAARLAGFADGLTRMFGKIELPEDHSQ